ncbi:MAG: hypothetical protein GY859_06565 [Desulfobacterales bacterium]|nr:hypothetical protein [Desulfobacterales bacterium]
MKRSAKRRANRAKRGRKRGSLGLWLLLMTILLGELLFYTWCRVQCVKTGYEIASYEEARGRLHTRQNELKIELASLKSPERIAEIARKKLGLVTPTSEQVITLP